MTQHTEIHLLIEALRLMGNPVCDAAADEIERLQERAETAEKSLNEIFASGDLI